MTDLQKTPADSAPAPLGDPFLSVRDLRIHFDTDDGLVRSVDGVSFDLHKGRTLGIVGESGSGKSVTSLGIMGLHRSKRARISGEILLDGEDLIAAGPDRVRQLRGRELAMIFQDPLTAMHPYYTVGAQIIEAYRVHHPKASKKEARARAVEMLDRVGIPQPDRRLDDYPHQFSGGMRQRAMIAMALVNDPSLLIADEPTTALDVTVQAQILDLIARIQQDRGLGVVMITHDLGVVARVAHEVLVMYGGRAAEQAPADRLFAAPAHPYTRGLLDSLPRLDDGDDAPLRAIPGSPPSLLAPAPGCSFAPRCARTTAASAEEHARCLAERPPLDRLGPPTAGHLAACHLPLVPEGIV